MKQQQQISSSTRSASSSWQLWRSVVIQQLLLSLVVVVAVVLVVVSIGTIKTANSHKERWSNDDNEGNEVVQLPSATMVVSTNTNSNNADLRHTRVGATIPSTRISSVSPVAAVVNINSHHDPDAPLKQQGATTNDDNNNKNHIHDGRLLNSDNDAVTPTQAVHSSSFPLATKQQQQLPTSIRSYDDADTDGSSLSSLIRNSRDVVGELEGSRNLQEERWWSLFYPPLKPRRCRGNGFGVSEIVEFQLINAAANTPWDKVYITKITDGAVIVLDRFNISSQQSSAPELNILALRDGLNGCSRSVRFGYNQTKDYYVDKYRFCGGIKDIANIENSSKPYATCDVLRQYGTHTVSATPYRRRGGRGQAGKTKTVSFTLLPYATNASQLENFVALSSTTTVNVTDQSATVEFEVTAMARKGLRLVSLAVYKPKTSKWNASSYLQTTLPINRTGEPTTVTVSMLIPQFAQPGIYPIELNLTDGSGDRNVWTSEDLAMRSFPSIITVESSIEDRVSPALTNFAIVPSNTVDVSMSSQTVNLVLELQDNLSGIYKAEMKLLCKTIYLENNTGVFILELPPFRRVGVGGVPYNWTIPVKIPRFIPEQRCTFELALYDGARNAAVYTSQQSNFLQNGWPNGLTIRNSVLDKTGPVVVDLIARNAEQPVKLSTAQTQGVNHSLIVQDDQSGFRRGNVLLYYWTPPDRNDNVGRIDVELPVPVAGTPVMLNLTFSRFSFSLAGIYKMTMYLEDEVSNGASCDSAKLATQGILTGTFTVVN